MGRRKQRQDAAPPESRPAPRDPLAVSNGLCQPVNLCDAWAGCSAFLVLGGPSLNDLPTNVLAERGVLSLGINNVAAYVNTTAFVCADPPNKMHQSIWFDPKIWKFIPTSKRNEGRGRLRIKENGKFRWSPISTAQCPSCWFFERDAEFDPTQWASRPTASWGSNKKGSEKTGRPRLLFTPLLGLRVLHYLGVREVFCLGMDFGMSTDQGYAFEQARDQDAVNANNHLYKTANGELTALRPYLDQIGFHVFNCNRFSGCSAFDYVPFEAALERVRGAVPQGPADLANWYDSKNQVDE